MGKLTLRKTISREISICSSQDSRHAGSLHGYGIVLHIQRASDELLNVEEGSLSALHRMEQSGWSIRVGFYGNESPRKYYKLTAAGAVSSKLPGKFRSPRPRCRAVLRYA